MFDATAAPAAGDPAPAGGLFGATGAAGAGLFSATATPATAPAAGGLFGATTTGTTPAADPAAGGLFGANPDAPKLPMSAYILFCADARPRLLEEQPTLAPIDVMKALGVKWKEADDEARKPYVAASAEAKLKYLEEKAAYTTKLRAEGGMPAPKAKESATVPAAGGGLFGAPVPAPSPAPPAPPAPAPPPPTRQGETVALAAGVVASGPFRGQDRAAALQSLNTAFIRDLACFVDEAAPDPPNLSSCMREYLGLAAEIRGC